MAAELRDGRRGRDMKRAVWVALGLVSGFALAVPVIAADVGGGLPLAPARMLD